MMSKDSTGEQIGNSGVVLARRVFKIAGIYGIIVLLPQYFLEGKLGRDYPPPITHPEHFYGFIGVALAWQVLFLIIATDPVRYRPAMIASVLEKLVFAIPCIVLYVQARLAPVTLAISSVDLILAVLFTISYRATRR